MRIHRKRDTGVATVDGRENFRITCVVRNELNGWRLLHNPGDVVFTVTKDGRTGDAYMPRPFPKGLWNG